MEKNKNLKKTLRIFRKHGGILRMSEAIRLGIHRNDLYKLRDSGDLEILSRGLYRLKDSPEPEFPDFIPIAKTVPNGIICLISALAYHEITTQIPHFVYLAIPLQAHKPTISHPPIRSFWYSDKMLSTGVEELHIDGCKIKIFDIEKTLIDCVKYRNKMGIDIVIEALKMYWRRKKTNINKLMHYAKLFRVDRFLKPIMETITNG